MRLPCQAQGARRASTGTGPSARRAGKNEGIRDISCDR
jgi:hypothetical protein